MFYLTKIIRLHYLVRLKIRVFGENSNAGKAILKKCCLLTLVLLIEKVAIFDFDIGFWQI